MYPYSIQRINKDIYPIFGNYSHKPGFIGMDDDSVFMISLKNEEIKNQKKFNERLSELDYDLIVSGYLEKRKNMFIVLGCEQMISEERFYHLGLDLTVKKGTSIFAPIGGTIYEKGYEEGVGNYGGYIIIKHEIDSDIFYSFYGHISYDNINVEEGDAIEPGHNLGIIGDYLENGGYFHHLHLQVITELGREKGFFSKGYCTKNQLEDIYKYAPNPSFLFKY